MKQCLKKLLTVCIAIHRHLTRTAVTTSAMMLFTTSGCIPVDSNEGEIIVNPAPDADADGDGVFEWIDCDDLNPEVGAPAEGEECEAPPIACEDDPDCEIIANPAPDEDGDGVFEWEDCDDTNPEIGAPAEGEECDPTPPDECEDDPDCEIIVNPAPDADGDGVPEWEDCDDMNPEIGAPAEGEECDPTPPDECEDDPDCGIIVNPARRRWRWCTCMGRL